VRVAIVTGRPLLLKGDPGSGKSSLAPYIARALKWRFYPFTVTGATQARDLMWQFDALRRLSDAQARRPGESAPSRVDTLEYYIDPKVLWWSLDPITAGRRGLPDSHALADADTAKDPGIGPSRQEASLPNGHGVVVLIDELDKADPDVPNNLLEALGSLQFTVQETQFPVKAAPAIADGTQHAPLVMVTTNDERELPAAFQRRCVTLYLERHGKTRLIEIAQQHLPVEANVPNPTAEAERRRTLFGVLADELVRLQGDAKKKGRREPSTAEYLDAAKACLALGVNPAVDKDTWAQIAELTLSKHDPFSKQKSTDDQAAAGS
jgi:MoxR-like ATPase